MINIPVNNHKTAREALALGLESVHDALPECQPIYHNALHVFAGVVSLYIESECKSGDENRKEVKRRAWCSALSGMELANALPPEASGEKPVVVITEAAKCLRKVIGGLFEDEDAFATAWAKASEVCENHLLGMTAMKEAPVEEA